MYSRYIPPPKEKQAPTNSQAATSQDYDSSAFSSSQPYARYVPGQAPETQTQAQPPVPAQPQRIVFDDNDFPAPNASKNTTSIDDELLGISEGKKAKKSKSKKGKTESSEDGHAGQLNGSPPRKRKRGEAEDVDPVDPPATEDQTASGQGTVDEPEASAVEAQEHTTEGEQKPKRDKKKKRKQADSQDAEAGDGGADDIRKRHKAVFEKVEKALRNKEDAEQDKEDGADDDAVDPGVEHGLQPLPQPEPVVFDESKLTYETLPPWLASPIRVAPDGTRPFTELGLAPESAKILESRGFKDAFAVQTAVLPLLLPNPDRQGDMVVAAPTGSGKTLSYVLPMIRDISFGTVTRLRALIILPTRDLVQQVQLACEACAAAFAVNGGKRVKIGTAMGNRVFKDEQAVIMDEEQRYDPEGYKEYLRKRNTVVNTNDSDSDDDDDLDLDRPEPFFDHVVAHQSKVDVLICTPGRLVEHISKTPGFTLDYVRWLIVDEADKLLAQDFQQWLGTVTDKLSVEKPGARDFMRSNKSGVRKVILSATMTRDLSLLNGLKLSRPKLVLVEGTNAGEQSLPATLREYAIKVREPSLKPLYLVDLLRSKHMAAVDGEAGVEGEDPAELESSDAESSSSSDSDPDSDSDSDASSSSSSSSSTTSQPKPKTTKTRPPTTAPSSKPPISPVLIFTKSNESALRLSRLLALLAPADLAPYLGTLTSATKTSRRARTLRAFAQGKVRILVASDLVARGIDLPALEHVVNYDLPATETGYVHRVGRTARAGREGSAWTLVEHAEGRRFWRDLAGEQGGQCGIVRGAGRRVERVRVSGGEGDGKGEEFAEGRVREYEEALGRLATEAAGGGEKGRKGKGREGR